MDRIVRGLVNTEIQRDVLGSDKMTLEKLLLFVEGKESGCWMTIETKFTHQAQAPPDLNKPISNYNYVKI